MDREHVLQAFEEAGGPVRVVGLELGGDRLRTIELAPSMTTSRPSSVDSPRATRSASGFVTTVLLSVSPGQSPTDTFVPAIMTTATASFDRSLAISSVMADSVALTKRRESDERPVPRVFSSMAAPTGSDTSTWRRVYTGDHPLADELGRSSSSLRNGLRSTTRR